MSVSFKTSLKDTFGQNLKYYRYQKNNINKNQPIPSVFNISGSFSAQRTYIAQKIIAYAKKQTNLNK